MDFRSLLSAAQQNVSTRGNSDKFYSTKFAPPKKSPKEKKLSDNIKRFLEKQKQEEEEKLRAARQKKQEMLARRDPKEQRKIDKTLKVIKSSKKYYTGDKELDEETAITMQNPFQLPDDDDYGYVSKTSEALYMKLMEKYKKMPEDNKFSSSQNGKASKSTSSDNNEDNHHFKNGHRQRVSKLPSEKEPTKKVPSSTSTSGGSGDNKKSTAASTDSKSKPPRPNRPPPPAINFEELLKLAAQKQHEDIVIDMPTTKKEPERLLTSKEKREMEELEAARKAKLMRAKEAATMNRIPKIGAATGKPGEAPSSSKQDRNNNDREKQQQQQSSSASTPPKTVLDAKKKSVQQKSSNESIDRRKGYEKQQPEAKFKSPASNGIHPSSSSLASSSLSSKSHDGGRCNKLQSQQKSTLPSKSVGATANLQSNGAKLKEALTKPTPSHTKPSSSSSKPALPVKTREFPPRDLKRAREFPPRDLKRPPMSMKKRRIIDEDDESEYDSELDDFIDDGEEDFNYSNEIQKIFGYNKAKYRDEDYDDREMESDYRTVMREEMFSKKAGLLEDLEDMRMEAEEKKRKEMMRKKMKKR